LEEEEEQEQEKEVVELKLATLWWKPLPAQWKKQVLRLSVPRFLTDSARQSYRPPTPHK